MLTIALLWALQQGAEPLGRIPDGFELLAGPYFTAEGVGFIAREKTTGRGLLQLGKKSLEFASIAAAPETLRIGTMPPDRRIVSVAKAMKGERAHFVAWCEIGIGVIGEADADTFDEISQPGFSRTGDLVSWIGHRGKSRTLVIGEKRVTLGSETVYGPNGDYCGYNVESDAGQDRGYRIWLHGKTESGLVANAVLSPDGKTCMYYLRNGRNAVLAGETITFVMEGRRMQVGGVGEFGWSPAGEPFFVETGWTKEKMPATTARLSIAGKKGPLVRWIKDKIVFSPDGKTPAYKAELPTKRFAIVRGTTTLTEYDDVKLPAWSPDGKTLAYAALQDRKWLVVLGDKPCPGAADIKSLRWSPDGARVVYEAVDASGTRVVEGDQAGEPFLFIQGLAFNPKTGRVAYVGHRPEERKTWLVLEGTLRDSASGGAVILFDRQGRSLVSRGQGPGAWSLFGDGKKLGDATRDPVADEGPCFRVTDGRTTRLVFIDGTTEDFVTVSKVQPAPDGRAMYWAAKGTRFSVYVGTQKLEGDFDSVYALHVSEDGKTVDACIRIGAELHRKTLAIPAP